MRSTTREFGRAKLRVTSDDPLLRGMPRETTVWMSHGDQVFELPEQFVPLAATPTCPLAATRHRDRPFWGVQFHPEVTHTPRGELIFLEPGETRHYRTRLSVLDGAAAIAAARRDIEALHVPPADFTAPTGKFPELGGGA